jgi:hypothetical protein
MAHTVNPGEKLNFLNRYDTMEVDYVPPPPPSSDSIPPPPPSSDPFPPPPPSTDALPPPPPSDALPTPPQRPVPPKKLFSAASKKIPLSIEDIMRKKNEAAEAAAKVSIFQNPSDVYCKRACPFSLHMPKAQSGVNIRCHKILPVHRVRLSNPICAPYTLKIPLMSILMRLKHLRISTETEMFNFNSNCTKY